MALQNNKIGFNCIASYALLYHGLSFIRSLSQLEALETGNALSLLLFSTPTFLMYTKPQWFACEIRLDLGVHNIQIIASFNLKQCDYVQDTFVVTVGNSFISIYEVII